MSVTHQDIDCKNRWLENLLLFLTLLTLNEISWLFFCNTWIIFGRATRKVSRFTQMREPWCHLLISFISQLSNDFEIAYLYLISQFTEFTKYNIILKAYVNIQNCGKTDSAIKTCSLSVSTSSNFSSHSYVV